MQKNLIYTGVVGWCNVLVLLETRACPAATEVHPGQVLPLFFLAKVRILQGWKARQEARCKTTSIGLCLSKEVSVIFDRGERSFSLEHL